MPTVLIAEDDLYMADMLQESLAASNYMVCGIARTVDEAVALGELHKPDLAVLDIRLAEGGVGTDIPRRWNKRDRPGVLYSTAYIGQTGLTKSDGEASLAKPYRTEDVVRALEIVEELVRSGSASRPYPKGFVVLNGPTEGDGGTLHEDNAIQEIARLQRQQQALATFGTYALGEDDLTKVLGEAARICADNFNVPYCKICRYRPDEGDLLIVAGVGWRKGIIGRVISVADASSPQGRAFSKREAVVCPDIRHDTGYVLPAFYDEYGIVSTADIVIQSSDGTPYGILEIDSPVEIAYDKHDIAFLTAFANILAEAVRKSRRQVELESSLLRMKDIVGDRERLIQAKDNLLAEKSVLARELQHRVRNNLQLIYSMLQRHIVATNAPISDSISAIARRVMTLSEVYEHLLGTGLGHSVEFGKYLMALCRDIEASSAGEHPSAKLLCHPANLHLDLDTTTGLGLAVSELIANCYAHAFPDGGGSIDVSAKVTGSEGIVLISDDGVGLVERADDKSQGIGLVRRLMQQIGGSATLSSKHGTQWTLKFPLGNVHGATA
jgi:two-component sensor histidine kinase/ActR/RegA family two-component response regulator